MPYQAMLVIGEFVCLEMKMIGKPYAEDLQVRFDEGEQDCVPGTILNGHEVGNDGYSQGSAYGRSRLFSTLYPSVFHRISLARIASSPPSYLSDGCSLSNSGILFGNETRKKR